MSKNIKISQLNETNELLENAYIPIIQGTPEQNYIIKADKLGGGLASVIADNDTITGNGTALDPLKATIKLIDSELAPENPTQGQRWVDPTSGIKYEYIDGIWVEFSAAGTSDGGGSTIELSTSLEETEPGKALDATMGSRLNNAKMNRLQGGTGRVDVVTLETLVGIGFDLSGANLSEANLEYARLSNAALSHSQLYGTNFSYANLSGAFLSYSELPYASFSNATLEGADFYNANLEGVDFSNATLSFAYFEGATGLDPDINIALANINKDPYGDSAMWEIFWTDGYMYQCDPSTGLFTQQ